MDDHTTTEDRIARLLDQLENPNLTDTEIARIQKKIEFYRTLVQPA